MSLDKSTRAFTGSARLTHKVLLCMTAGSELSCSISIITYTPTPSDLQYLDYKLNTDIQVRLQQHTLSSLSFALSNSAHPIMSSSITIPKRKCLQPNPAQAFSSSSSSYTSPFSRTPQTMSSPSTPVDAKSSRPMYDRRPSLLSR